MPFMRHPEDAPELPPASSGESGEAQHGLGIGNGQYAFYISRKHGHGNGQCDVQKPLYYNCIHEPLLITMLHKSTEVALLQ